MTTKGTSLPTLIFVILTTILITLAVVQYVPQVKTFLLDTEVYLSNETTTALYYDNLKGTDKKGCGTEKKPCKSQSYLLNEWKHKQEKCINIGLVDFEIANNILRAAQLKENVIRSQAKMEETLIIEEAHKKAKEIIMKAQKLADKEDLDHTDIEEAFGTQL